LHVSPSVLTWNLYAGVFGLQGTDMPHLAIYPLQSAQTINSSSDPRTGGLLIDDGVHYATGNSQSQLG
jgi:hypothetical protein